MARTAPLIERHTQEMQAERGFDAGIHVPDRASLRPPGGRDAGSLLFRLERSVSTMWQ